VVDLVATTAEHMGVLASSTGSMAIHGTCLFLKMGTGLAKFCMRLRSNNE
jgi:hypothetical protein